MLETNVTKGSILDSLCCWVFKYFSNFDMNFEMLWNSFFCFFLFWFDVPSSTFLSCRNFNNFQIKTIDHIDTQTWFHTHRILKKQHVINSKNVEQNFRHVIYWNVLVVKSNSTDDEHGIIFWPSQNITAWALLVPLCKEGPNTPRCVDDLRFISRINSKFTSSPLENNTPQSVARNFLKSSIK